MYDIGNRVRDCRELFVNWQTSARVEKEEREMQTLGPTVQELFDMTGMVALVTGGCRGLGLDEANALVVDGGFSIFK